MSVKIDKIGDDKIIGLSTLGALKWGSVNNSSSSTGAIIVPARALGDKVDGEKTQRQIYWNRWISLLLLQPHLQASHT
jgi:hypothetical protein